MRKEYRINELESYQDEISIKLSDHKTMIYFTADTHFGHANIVKMCEWPYPDIESMNEAMIEA